MTLMTAGFTLLGLRGVSNLGFSVDDGDLTILGILESLEKMDHLASPSWYSLFAFPLL